MKKTKLSVFLSSGLALSMALSMVNYIPAEATDGITVNEANFPDEIFRSYVSERFDKDKSGTLSESEISAVKEISVTDMGISDLTGVKYFTELTYLDCFNNQLTSLDVSNNRALIYLFCNNNQLTSLDVANNMALRFLYCFNNQLTSLDVSANTALMGLSCYGNQLTSLDVSDCANNIDLTCTNNTYRIGDVDGSYSLGMLTGFDSSKASGWSGAEYDSMTNSLINFTSQTVTYNYDCGKGKSATFTLIADSIKDDTDTDAPEEPEKPVTPETPEKPVTPEAPEEPEKPVTPEAPEEPENPVIPEAPEEPEKPVTPEEHVHNALRSELVIAPTATSAGKVDYYCTECGESVNTVIIPAIVIPSTGGGYASPSVKPSAPSDVKHGNSNADKDNDKTEEAQITAKPIADGLRLSWKEVGDADSYVIYQKINGKYKKITEVEGTECDLTKLTDGKTYRFLVRARTDGRLILSEDCCRITVEADFKPDVEVKVNGNSARLTWNEIKGAEQYAVYKIVDGKAKKLRTGEKLSVTIKGLKPDSEYQYIVRACIDGKWTKMKKSDIINVETE